MYPASTRSLLFPTQPTPLVARTDELASIHRRLTDEGARLLTLVGPAGVGKTRLALAAAEQLAEQAPARFASGVTLVDLAPVRDPALVLPTIAQSLGLIDTGQPPLLERLRAFLREGERLLVLDNFEQILPAASALADLLTSCPRLALLVTSRVPLALRWEQTLRIAPLAVPDLSMALPPPDELAQIPAITLFVERARARRADFALTTKQAPLVAQMAVQMDGLPLALELVAARLGVLRLSTIARLLRTHLRVLHWEAGDLPTRQQSLEAAVGWSYELLSADEQRLFRCLGVFVGRVSLDAIAHVAAAVRVGTGETADARDEGNEGSTLEGLVSLAEKSLVLMDQRDEEDDGADDGEPSFGMLETVREYACERLAEHGELAPAGRAHAHYFLALADHADPLLRGRDQRAWYLRLERERANLRAALGWLLEQGTQGGPAEQEAGLQLAGALGWFWWLRGYWSEGRHWLGEALSGAPTAEEGADLAVRTRALLAAGPLLTLQPDFAEARVVLEEARTLAERQQDSADSARAFTYLGFRALIAGEVEEAPPLLQDAVRRWEAVGNPQGLGQALFFLGTATAAAGDAAAAAVHYEAALEGMDAARDVQSAAIVHCYLGVLTWRRGELSRAAMQIQAAVRTGVALRDRLVLSLAAQSAVVVVGEHAEPAARARLLGATATLVQATGATPAWERLPAEQDVAAIRERLAREGEEGELAAAYREGRALPFGEVAVLALRLLEEVATPRPAAEGTPGITSSSAPPAAGAGPLSLREQEVLRLVAQGLSSKAIGRQLFLATSTVNYHLTSVFNKLGVNTRAQAVAVAAERNLL